MKQFAHQGDVQIFTVCEIPKDAKKVEKQFSTQINKTQEIDYSRELERPNSPIK
jgi:hypothetical protein